ncbi:hypothetical protein RI129_010961 [Pyrocoelia pectoralis]|uniref:Nucleolar 27S pre-rRNA processing Urb2/Npa2 C-terminal domain-containing protein n=1 Tax=Pyrocoelia pectoralis TaxID=417401 RepID=A0AAN7UZZ8_9COLE
MTMEHIINFNCELINLLDNDGEPLPKRLKIADNAFTSCSLPIQHREAVLLEWLTKLTKSNEKEVWNLLLKWLQSAQVHNLSRSDVNDTDLRNLNTMLCKRLKYAESNSIATDCILEIIKNRNFQLYFKHNLEEHCKFIGKFLLKIKSTDQLHKVLTNEQLLNRNITYGEDFYRNFISHTLTPLCVSVGRFSNDHQLFIDASKLLEKCLFMRNFNAFSTFLAKGETDFPKLLFDHMQDVYHTDDAVHVYNLTFYSFCKSYNNVNTIYSCFTLLVEMLGVNGDCTEKSVEVLTQLCAVLSECGVRINTKVDHTKFTDSFEKILNSVINNLKPCKVTYIFLNKIIALDPVLMQKNLMDILKYILLSTNDGVEEEYATFLLSLFEVFAKLHRISNLLTAMMSVLKSSIENPVVIPDVVLKFFSQIVVTLPSWQSLDLLKMLLANLDAATSNLDEGNFCNNNNYLQLIDIFLCLFLSSVRIAEHVVPVNIVENFEKLMLELKDILKRFGTTLLAIEHKPILMRVYLNICFMWGELYMVLAYYSSEVNLKKHIDNDPSACNVTYIHSYLNRAQWRLISQRITNFGEQPCKKIMQRLCVQKLRAMNLFEADVSREATLAVAVNLISSSDELSQDLFFDNFILHNVVIPSSGMEIADVLVKTIIKTGDFQKLQMFNNNVPLIREIIYVCLVKLSKSFASKVRADSVTSRMLNSFDKSTFHATNMVKELKQKSQTMDVNEIKVSQYLEMIKSIPIPQFDDKNIQEVVLIYLIGLALDMQCCKLQDKAITRQLEKIVIGIVQSSVLLNVFFESNVILTIVNNFESYSEVFTIIMQGILKNKSRLDSFKSIIGDFTQNFDNIRYRDCAVIFLNYVDKVKTKVAVAEKHLHNVYREQICRCLLPFLLNDSSCAEDSLEAYALTLKFYLNNDSKEVLEELVPLVEKYLDVLQKAIIEEQTIRNEVKMWNAISSCDLNSAQTKIWQASLESLLYQIILTNANYCDKMFEHIVTLQISFIQNSHFILSPSLIEVVLITISKINAHGTNSIEALNLSISLLEALIKHRKTVITDYLPPYLQRYRTVLIQLCSKSNTNLKLNQESIQELANCAHKFERLTKTLRICDKSMMRISPYVIADVLNQFEKVTLYPNIKIHLSNSIYQLLSMCDEHGIAFLKRVLSTASTEMFKIISDNYNKYYKFTGKV